MYVCMYVCVCEEEIRTDDLNDAPTVCMYVCMYVCMNVCVCEDEIRTDDLNDAPTVCMYV